MAVMVVCTGGKAGLMVFVDSYLRGRLEARALDDVFLELTGQMAEPGTDADDEPEEVVA
jgi:hypothetical protein